MIFYLTYSEAPSGIFSSQVIDVVKFIKENLKVKIRLVAFISLRGYFKNRSVIKAQMPDAIILPMAPRMSNWAANRFLLSWLCGIYRPHTIIARSVLATQLALMMRNKKDCSKVIYDGRGAIAAEWEEYKVVTDPGLLSVIHALEQSAIAASDARLAVSHALIVFWEKEYGYRSNNHVIIPCTLTQQFSELKLSQSAILDKRKELELMPEDTVYIYSGSVAGWQSFGLLLAFMEPILGSSSSNKIIFFSPPDKGIEQFQKLYPTQVLRRHLKPAQVADYLIAGDYGLLIRERSVTNLVASPVKYAEYLACGLKVILSEGLGDYTALSLEKNWGYVYNNFPAGNPPPSFAQKQVLSGEAIRLFSKKNYTAAYTALIG